MAERFAIIPAAALERLPALSGAAAKILVAFGMFMSRDGECWPSREAIMKASGVRKPHTIAAAIRELVEIGILNVARRPNRSSIYTWAEVPESGTTGSAHLRHSEVPENGTTFLMNNPMNNPIAGETATPRRAKKTRKVKFVPPTFEEFKDYCRENGFEHIARRAFKHYEAGDWHDAKGKAVCSWKQKLQSVWFDEVKNPAPPEPDQGRSFTPEEVERLGIG
jgi:hypothetical protein